MSTVTDISHSHNYNLLPDDVMYEIFAFLDVNTARCLSEVCKRWRTQLRPGIALYFLKSMKGDFNHTGRVEMVRKYFFDTDH
jgi:hypothetical protein